MEGLAVLIDVDDSVPCELNQEILYEAVLKGHVATNIAKFEAELANIRELIVKEIDMQSKLETRRRFLLGYETATAQVISERFGWYMGAAERELDAEDTIKPVDEELDGLREELKHCEAFLSIILRDYENNAGRCMEELQQKTSNLVAVGLRIARAEAMLKDILQHQEATRNLKVIDMGKKNIWKMGKKYMWSCIGISTLVGFCLLVSAHGTKASESKLHLPR